MLNLKIIGKKQKIAIGYFPALLIIWGFTILCTNTLAQAPIITYPTPQVYTVNTAITPLTPTNTGGQITNTGYGLVSTFAGALTAGAANGTGNAASFSSPQSIAIDGAGNFYVADFNNRAIRKITPAGVVTTFASGFSGPTGVIVDGLGNVFVADFAGHVIKKIDPNGVVSVFAGNGTPVLADGTGTAASFNGPSGLAVDANNNIYVADLYNNAIRKITPAGVVTTFAGGTIGQANGPGAAAQFSHPNNLVVDPNGNIFVVDGGNNSIREVTPAGVVTTVAGLGGPVALNNINLIGGDLKLDNAGNIYVTSQNKHTILKITLPGTSVILAGSTGVTGSADGIGTAATFNRPQGLVFDNTGNIFVTDQNNNEIRKISTNGYTIDIALPPGLTFNTFTGVISGTPTAASPATNYTITAYNSSGSSVKVVNITVNASSGSNNPPATVAAPNISYVTPQTYTVNTPITALLPTNTGGAVPATVYGQVSTFAGTGATGFINGTGTSASFNNPTRLGQDAAGNLYVADRGNNVIRKITPAGVVTTFANGFNQPNGVTVDASGNVYVADAANNLIKKITPGGAVSTFAGSVQGSSNGVGVAANFFYPYSLATDGTGNMFVADSRNNLIRKMTPAAAVSTLAGNGSPAFADGPGASASFNAPSSVAVDPAGSVIVADPNNNRIRKITPAGLVSTIAGTGVAGTANGSNLTATFTTPAGVTVDQIGNIYIAEIGSNLIREISASGVVTTLAGSGAAGAADGIGRAASFNRPNDVQSNPGGFLYVTDYGNNLIRKIIVTGYTIDKPLPAGLAFDPTTGTISGTPTAASPATDYTVTAYNTGGSSTAVVNIKVLVSVLLPSIITFPIIPQGNGSNLLTPTATSTNNETPIVYTSSNTSVAIITPAGKIQLVGPGLTTITATQVGNANYSPAIPQMQGIDNRAGQFITFTAIVAKTTCDFDFLVGAGSTNNTIPLTYSSSNPAVATISAVGLVHILTAGTATLTVSQPGNSFYNPAQPQSQVLTVTLPVNPIVTIAPDVTSVCTGAPVTFTATVSNIAGTNFTYQWKVNNVGVATSPTFTSTTLKATDVVQCIVTTINSCPGSGTSNPYTGLIVSTTVAPQITISSSGATPGCIGTPATFTATATNIGANPTYQWQVNGITAGTNSPQFTSNDLANNDKITCILLNNSSPCVANSVIQSNTIVVSFVSASGPAPSIIIGASANNVYPGIPITFTATSANAGTGSRYQWQVNGENSGTNSNTFTSTILNNGDIVTCILLLNQGCIPIINSNELTVDILLPPNITVPNTFTPNGDGINDLWNIPELKSYPNCLVTIFTRYGGQVYQSKGYSKPWEGAYKGGQLPAGVYYYRIDLGNKAPELSGWVAIIR